MKPFVVKLYLMYDTFCCRSTPAGLPASFVGRRLVTVTTLEWIKIIARKRKNSQNIIMSNLFFSLYIWILPHRNRVKITPQYYMSDSGSFDRTEKTGIIFSWRSAILLLWLHLYNCLWNPLHTLASVWDCWTCIPGLTGRMSGDRKRNEEEENRAGGNIDLPFVLVCLVWLTHVQRHA